jgi:hypothetical protein
VGEAAKYADPLMAVLGEECVKMLFSKAWATKDEGLKFLEAEVERPTKIDASDL